MFSKSKTPLIGVPRSGELTNRYMICTVCGRPYPCAHAPASAASITANLAEAQSLAADAQSRADQRTWREEISLRVNRHRARRRGTDDGSLEFDFPPQETSATAAADSAGLRSVLPTAVQHAIAERSRPAAHAEQSGDLAVQLASSLAEGAVSRRHQRKVIRFPKYANLEVTPRPQPLITEVELAEPVPEAPRILDAPPAEQMELLPSFADIQLEEDPGDDRATDLELPLRPAPLAQRLMSGLLDGGIVFIAMAMFGATFIKIAETTPPVRLALISTLVSGVALWLVFQYLFLVYGAKTPGMRAAQLELFAFRGERASLPARRYRALAVALSAISVGLGFAWALVDEDTLGWHDRISQTYLRSGDPVIGRSGDR